MKQTKMINANHLLHIQMKKESKGDEQKQKSNWNHDDCAILHKQKQF